METNPIIDKLPRHLMSLVIEQPYNAYTPQDHAVWRYVMRQNVRHLGKVAHPAYLEGLARTGIGVESIPSIEGMNRILREIGWAAVAVDGFVPPAAFMAFQAYRVLVIAADIRPIDQIGYTPAPDIIHEAAGHAPIIADPQYADFLQRFGELGAKAFLSPQDYQLYEAIRHLSIIKADPYSSPETIAQAEERLASVSSRMGEPSELARIRNLHWWTVEYGLIGTPEDPKIYGAGLLSSIEESVLCLEPGVKKILLTMAAAECNYDITEPQPQLFVTPDFGALNQVLDEFAATLAVTRGGLYGIRQAIRSGSTATVAYNSGLEVSGTFTKVIEKNEEPVYLKTTGPSNLNIDGKELPGHDTTYHAHGFGSPVGRVRNLAVPLEDFSEEELEQVGLITGETVHLEFESGVTVSGTLCGKVISKGRLVLLSFDHCRVEYQGRVLFEPGWGTFDMAVGSRIVSAWSGPADPDAFGFSYPVPAEKTHKVTHSGQALRLHRLYRQVREIREGKDESALLPGIWEELRRDYPDDWLCALEILELCQQGDPAGKTAMEIGRFLDGKRRDDEALAKLIGDGLAMIHGGGA
ncbi:MAG TPA: aromatic amino acid hydroxylase [Bacteroidales bacterium]|nr:aromatic amino acid hydroxylase [Bacteroidales bacterium]